MAAGVGAAAAALGKEAGASLLCRGMAHFSSACWLLGQDERLSGVVSERRPCHTELQKLYPPAPRCSFEILHSAM